jgi:P4 family phage/plasmid primase-like protien
VARREPPEPNRPGVPSSKTPPGRKEIPLRESSREYNVNGNGVKPSTTELAEKEPESARRRGRGRKPVPTHDELRDRWLKKCEERGEHTAHGQGEWRRYANGFWTPLHQQVVDAEIDLVLEEAKPQGVKPTAWLRSSVEQMAQARAYVLEERWDSNPDVLVCTNGTLEISSMTLREHRPEDYALSTVPFAYDPKAEAPTWRRFLDSTVPKAQRFLQEFAGYCLTPETLHELAVWLYGPPGTGKSTFIEGLKAMLGDRAGLLGLADIQRSQFALSKLPGKTLVVATEQPSDFVSCAHVLNAIISGEEIQVEEKFKPSYAVIPRAKICWGMNELPRVKDAYNGLFRRVKVISFPTLAVEPDPAVKEAIKAEGAGILNWALEGLTRLNERGHFEIPESVRDATEEFRLTNDVPRMFVEEACNTREGLEIQAQELYDGYRHYCLIKGHKPQSATSVASDWKRLGFGSRKLHGRKFYLGVEVDSEWIGGQDDYPRTR